MRKIKKSDEVIVITGKDRGRLPPVLRVLDDDRVVVENINMTKRHTKANPQAGEAGGILDKEMPIQISNVALFNPETQKADRAGFKILEDGRKVRIFKSTGEVVDV